MENVLVRHIDTLLNFLGFVTANCSETEIARSRVCSFKLLVSEMDEKDSKALGAVEGGQRADESCACA